MLSTEIKLYLVRIFGNEGGYVSRPLGEDPGGETKWGITKRYYPDLDIKNLTLKQAGEIYERDYIQPFLKDGIPPSCVYQLTDFAVNSGVHQAIVSLQRCLGLEADGRIGPKTIAKIKETSESDLVMQLTAERLDFLTSLKNWQANSKGWARRVAANLRYGAVDTD